MDQGLQTVELGDKVETAGKVLARTDFEQHQLPWRVQCTPYRVFLAEFLLVRTRTDVVATIYESVFHAYPLPRDLASANEEDLLRILRPLGLQKRIRYLKRAAQYLVTACNGEIPCNIPELKQVPGIGDYTAAAIVAFACNEPAVPADVNILRFVSRLTGLDMRHATKGSKELRNLLPYLSLSSTGLRPQNLLDFSRTICRPRSPLCPSCPLTMICSYFTVDSSPD